MIPLIHFYSTMTICQVEYMNQSVLNDIRNNGYIRYDGDIYNCKYEKVHSIHDEILQRCSDDQFPMIPRWRYLRWNG